MPPVLLRVVIADNPPARLDKALARDVPPDAHLSRSRLARLIADGCVSRNGAVLTQGTASVAAGDAIDIALAPPRATHIAPEALPLRIVHEDADLLVIDKPAGMVVHPAPGSASGTLVNALLHHLGTDLSGVGGVGRPGIVHRIDKDTSGLLVVAKTDRAHHGLSAQFAAHDVEREYAAICHGVPDPGDPRLRGLDGVTVEPGAVMRIATMLGRHPADRQRQAVVKSGRHAITRFRVERPLRGAAALLRCWLETGRTHQIRVHLAYAGHSLLGDPVYGRRRALSSRTAGERAAEAAGLFPRQALHAATLGFVHPATGGRISFASPLPSDMTALLAAFDGETDDTSP
ncbi:Pseudouridine synthase, RluD [Oceaniovalibus guishaninsula JLT2003]|uniref:Pseudouridine synthase n=1 Tax=Oceaniovalibus guishaninsula JLT2003 TaxID=1231392 RepID=K2HEG4_9RHOB|nr:RluA family pseudouridine synthase [Oceaniovalibus guishaninsula]EKE45853.1 Pseudouridine synthase, RluD [Oceaniovalibus guishaninsula JLT2003]